MNSRLTKIKELMVDSPDDTFLRHALALEYQKLGNDPEARLILENLLIEFPDYIGSYYQLGKLLERQGETELAKNWYSKGMEAANKNDDQHSYNELSAAYEDLL